MKLGALRMQWGEASIKTCFDSPATASSPHKSTASQNCPDNLKATVSSWEEKLHHHKGSLTPAPYQNLELNVSHNQSVVVYLFHKVQRSKFFAW
eukprot:CAMPEP_0174338202 /NCGR_PEP_ID=MMETSP0810-20121108/22965_1 /TAXON_ID=73025 ORGANISM="Eutreptiella gymnastica-like, Strain CCMP1594" /NCGR_SAMPLE_ID=MMETSP0810 /ASSEMBLY_ACC=CAM_ASM_000659 /LENGTH=93 /DNA_ID=CAMNT_0015458181 /DNA_START=321 /DNA_END=599 /DNA_ORIENTATION=-